MSTSEQLTSTPPEAGSAVSAYDRFRQRSGGLWQRYLRHPWFEGVARGDLSDERFLHFVAHDRPYIREFQQAQLRTAALYDDLSVWLPALRLIAEEGDLEDSLLGGLGHGLRVEDRWDVCAAREGYMNHIYVATTSGDAAVAVASLLPCGSGFGEITRSLADVDASGHHEHFRAWLAFYCSDQQWAYSSLLVELLEVARQTARSTEDEQFRAFHRSLQHQVRVLDAAWDLDDGW